MLNAGVAERAAGRELFERRRLALLNSGRDNNAITAGLQELNAAEFADQAHFEKWIKKVERTAAAIDDDLRAKMAAAAASSDRYSAIAAAAADKDRAEQEALNAIAERQAAVRTRGSDRAAPRQSSDDSTGSSIGKRMSVEWERQMEVERAVDIARQQERHNAQARVHGGGVSSYSSNYLSLGNADPVTAQRIDAAVSGVRAEEQNNHRAKASNGITTHSSSNSFDYGAR